MQLKQLFDDEDAVSPVIGVILMVAITVILAAVIGTFVLGLGDQVQSSAPNANFQFQYDDGDTTAGYQTSDGDDSVTITHNGGQDVDPNNVVVQIEGTEATGVSWSDSTISTGTSITVTDSEVEMESGDTVRVVWTSPNGGSSNTIGQSTVPS